MFNKRKSLLLGFLAAATATGLALGVNGVVDAYVGEPVEVSAAPGDVLATYDGMPNNYGSHENFPCDDGTTWSASYGQGNYLGSNNKESNYNKLYLGDFISIDGVDSQEKYKVVLVCEDGLENVDSIGFSCDEVSYSNPKVTVIYGSSPRGDGTFYTTGEPVNNLDTGDTTFNFDCLAGKNYVGLLFESESYFRLRNVSVKIYEGSGVAVPDDAKPASVELDYGTGKTSYYKGDELDLAGYSVKVTYKSESNHDFSDTEALEPNDSRLTWKFDSETVGETELVATFNDGVNEPVDSNAINVEVKDNSNLIFDELTAESLKLGGSYGDVTSEEFASGAVYLTNGMTKSGGSEIQIRSKEGSGIVAMSSNLFVKAIEVKFDDSTDPDRVLQVYGKDTSYSSPDNLYGSSTSGTLLHEFKASDGLSQSFELSSDYQFIGLRSSSNAMYLDSVRIIYESSDNEISGDGVAFAEMFLETITCDDGVTAPDANNWEFIGGMYVDLASTDKEFFKAANANAEGTEVEQCVARYDYIVGKYGPETYNDFMGRNPARIASALSIRNSDDVMDIAVISALAIAGIAAAGAFVFLRRKKEA